jgi:hypothetical protein
MNGLINQRRVLATLLLAAAIALLILGETLLKHRLGPVATLAYWTGCLLATVWAILFALLDLSRSMRESRAEQRTMIEQAIHEIEAERERRKQSPINKPPESR